MDNKNNKLSKINTQFFCAISTGNIKTATNHTYFKTININAVYGRLVAIGASFFHTFWATIPQTK